MATRQKDWLAQRRPEPLFVTTRWSVVLAASQGCSCESAPALEAICRAYWFPLYAYARRCGQSPHDAQDLTQEFFYRLVEKRWLESADRTKGKLRTFLIVALKNFMSQEWRRACAQRRGGGQLHVPIDTAFAESRYAAEKTTQAADETYDREWALTLLDMTVSRLRDELSTCGRAADFEALKSCLMAARGTIDYGSIAAQLGVGEGAARVTVHRLRKRFREIFREEIANTLTDDTDVEEEMRHLAAALI